MSAEDAQEDGKAGERGLLKLEQLRAENAQLRTALQEAQALGGGEVASLRQRIGGFGGLGALRAACCGGRRGSRRKQGGLLVLA